MSFIISVENCYSQLVEVNQKSPTIMSHIDDLCDKLPLTARKDWKRRHRCWSELEHIDLFTLFMMFLEF